MAFDLWMRLSGTLINMLTVALGTGVGVVLGERLPARTQRILAQGVGLITLLIGTQLGSSLAQAQAGQVDGIILGLLALTLGGAMGEWAQIEERLQTAGEWLKRRFQGSGRFTEGFVTASLLFCIGPLTLLGSLNNGLTGDARLLTLKAIMDGIAAIALSSSLGLGVGFSILVIGLYQGGVALAAGLLAQSLPDPATDPRVLLVTGVGGLMILGLGINLLDIGRIRVASFLPALFLAPLLFVLATWVG